MPTPTQPAASQSPADRKSAESQVRNLITKFAPDQLKLVTAARNAIQERLPNANELAYEYRSWFVLSFSPSEHGHEGVLAIRGDSDGIKFYFNHGKSLPDPEKLLQGSATVRYIDLESASTLTRPAVVALIEAAIAHNKIPFAKSGQGSIILRLAGAKKTKPKAKK